MRRLFLALFLAAAALTVADIATSHHAVAAGLGVELNPVLVAWELAFGTGTGALLAALALFLLGWALWLLIPVLERLPRHRRATLAVVLVSFLIALTVRAAVVASNLLLIARGWA